MGGNFRVEEREFSVGAIFCGVKIPKSITFPKSKNLLVHRTGGNFPNGGFLGGSRGEESFT